MGWKAASVPTLSVRLTWTLGRSGECTDNVLLTQSVPPNHGGTGGIVNQIFIYSHLKNIKSFQNTSQIL